MPADTIPYRVQQHGRERPSSPAYHVRGRDRWIASSWRDYAAEVRRAGRALIELGVEPGQTVCILGFNRPEWVVMDVAAMSVGAAPAGIYTTSSPEEVRYIAHHCEASVVLVENEAQWRKVEHERKHLPALRHVVTMRGAPEIDDPLVLSWDRFLARGDDTPESRFEERLDTLKAEQLATLIYTSGTTGPPKGVMLSHQNLAWTAGIARDLVVLGPDDCSLSYLPLSHIAEQMFTIHVPATVGGSVYYAESIEKLADNLKEVQPTVFFGVPRIWEKMHAGVAAKLAQAPAARKALATWATSVGRRMCDCRNASTDPPIALALQYRVASRILTKVRAAMGLGRGRAFVSGAAPIAREVLEFLAGLDVNVLEVYGQSEGSGPTSFNRPGRTRFGSVGPPLPGVEVRIAGDGEVLVKGPNVFLGYYKEPEATAETLVDGWLHSGDLGEIDGEGYLHITGRKKDLIITAGGKNIAPKNLEAALKNHELVGEAVVIGDRRKYLTALITLDPDAARAFLESRGLDASSPHEAPEVKAAVQRVVDDVNASLARVETVKRFRILARPFSIETGELTPTLKIKRKVVAEHYAADIEAMYRDPT